MTAAPPAGCLVFAAFLALAGCATTPHVPPPQLRVTADRDGTRVDLPACPNWSRSSLEDFSNRAASNFGCADAINLGLQVAEPLDLVRGRSGQQDGAAATAAITRYRAGTPTPLSGSSSVSGPAATAADPAGTSAPTP